MATAELDLPTPSQGGWRAALVITESAWFKNFILLCIIANAVALGMDAELGPDHPWHPYFENADVYFLAIFTAEIALEFVAGPRRWARNAWNWFDFFVVAISYIATMPFISALRTLRVLRVLRLVSAVPQMRRVVEALFGAMPGIVATIAVLAVVFYISAVMSTTLFGPFCANPSAASGFAPNDPENVACDFVGLGPTTLTLVKLTLFDDWGATVATMDRHAPWAWAFILVFTVIAAFAVLNLFIGVIVDAVQETREHLAAEIKEDVSDIEREVGEIEEGVQDISDAQDRAADERRMILEELRALRAEIATLRSDRPTF